MEEGVKGMFDFLTSASFDGVLAGITELLPKVLPAMIGFIALRKGISFIQSILRGA